MKSQKNPKKILLLGLLTAFSLGLSSSAYAARDTSTDRNNIEEGSEEEKDKAESVSATSTRRPTSLTNRDRTRTGAHEGEGHEEGHEEE